MTSYYDVFEVAPGDEPSGVSEGDSEWNPSDVMCLVKNSWATWRGWEGRAVACTLEIWVACALEIMVACTLDI